MTLQFLRRFDFIFRRRSLVRIPKRLQPCLRLGICRRGVIEQHGVKQLGQVVQQRSQFRPNGGSDGFVVEPMAMQAVTREALQVEPCAAAGKRERLFAGFEQFWPFLGYSKPLDLLTEICRGRFKQVLSLKPGLNCEILPIGAAQKQIRCWT